MKTLKILEEFGKDAKLYLDSFDEGSIVDEEYLDARLIAIKISDAIKELKELNSVLIDLFTCIEFTEDENAEKRLSSMETYLIRLARFKSE